MGQLWQHGWEVDTGTRMEIAGWLRSRAGVREVGAGDFEHKGAATSDGLVGMSLRVVFCIVISGVQEESMGPVEASVV